MKVYNLLHKLKDQSMKRKENTIPYWTVNFWSDWSEILFVDDDYSWAEFTVLNIRFEKEFFTLSTGRQSFYFGLFGFNWEFSKVVNVPLYTIQN